MGKQRYLNVPLIFYEETKPCTCQSVPLDLPQRLLLSASCFCRQLAIMVNQRLPKATPRETQLPWSPDTVQRVPRGLEWLSTAEALGTFPGQ